MITRVVSPTGHLFFFVFLVWKEKAFDTQNTKNPGHDWKRASRSCGLMRSRFHALDRPGSLDGNEFHVDIHSNHHGRKMGHIKEVIFFNTRKEAEEWATGI